MKSQSRLEPVMMMMLMMMIWWWIINEITLRLEPVMMELERQGNVLLVAHQAVLRYLYFCAFVQCRAFVVCAFVFFVLSLADEAHIKFSDNSSIINQTIQRVDMLYYIAIYCYIYCYITIDNHSQVHHGILPWQVPHHHHFFSLFKLNQHISSLMTSDQMSRMKSPKLSPLCFSRPLEDLPYIKVPLHTLIKLTPQAYGCEAEFIRWREASYFLWHFLEMKGFDFKLIAECWRLIALTL